MPVFVAHGTMPILYLLVSVWEENSTAHYGAVISFFSRGMEMCLYDKYWSNFIMNNSRLSGNENLYPVIWCRRKNNELVSRILDHTPTQSFPGNCVNCLRRSISQLYFTKYAVFPCKWLGMLGLWGVGRRIHDQIDFRNRAYYILWNLSVLSVCVYMEQVLPET